MYFFLMVINELISIFSIRFQPAMDWKENMKFLSLQIVVKQQANKYLAASDITQYSCLFISFIMACVNIKWPSISVAASGSAVNDCYYLEDYAMKT